MSDSSAFYSGLIWILTKTTGIQIIHSLCKECKKAREKEFFSWGGAFEK